MLNNILPHHYCLIEKKKIRGPFIGIAFKNIRVKKLGEINFNNIFYPC